MAENKKSIIVYSDWMKLFEALSDDEAGRVIKHFFRYVNDLNPIAPDRITELSFIQIEQSLKRDLKKYEEKCSKNKENANIRWDKKNANASERIKRNAKNADSDNVSDNDNEININVYRKFAHLSISITDFEKLCSEYTPETVNRIIDSIENFKDNKKYKSLYLTAKNWLTKEPKKTDIVKPRQTLII